MGCIDYILAVLRTFISRRHQPGHHRILSRPSSMLTPPAASGHFHHDPPWDKGPAFLSQQQKHQLMESLSRVIDAMGLMHDSCKHPDPHIGGNEIERDLQRVIPYGQFLLNTMPPNANDTDRVALLHLQCDAFFLRYRRAENPDDLQQALTLAEEAMTLMPPDDEDTLRALLGHLAEILHHTYMHTRFTEDLERGIMWSEQAVAATPPNAPHRICRISWLATLLHDRYTRSGDETDLKQSILYTEETVQAVPGSLEYLNLLANRLHDRYNQTGAENDLQRATHYAEEVLAATQHGDPTRCTRLNNLANKYIARYVRHRELIDSDLDLNLAISLAKEAEVERAESSSDTDDRWPWSSLGGLLHVRYDLSGNMDDLDEAIVWTEKNIARAPLNDPIRPLYLFNLANKLFAKYTAISENVIIHDATDFSNPHLMDMLCTSVESRSKKFKIDHLDKAIALYKEALKDLPLDHVGRARVLHMAANAIELRYARLYLLQDLQDAIHYYAEAMDYNISPPIERIQSARGAAKLQYLQKNFEAASHCLTCAVKLLSLVSPRSLQRDDQQHMLSQLSGLAADAAAVALQAGQDATEALQLLELGRGLILGFTIDLRSDVSALKTTHPCIFDGFERLRDEIGSKGPDLEMTRASDRSNFMQQHMARQQSLEESYKAMEAMLVEIRALPGYESFLLPLKPDMMMSIAHDGAIVVFNSTDKRSDAITITRRAISLIPLPNLKFSDVEQNVLAMNEIFKDGRRATRGARNTKLSKLLVWLWETAVKSVCDELGLGAQEKPDKLERVWWIGVGLLNKLPFHAAGDHTKKSLQNVISLVCSSYIPTVKALSYAREQVPAELNLTQARISIISMPVTPGHEVLGSVEGEIKAIEGYAHKSSIPIKRLDRPSKEEVKRNLCKPDDKDRTHLVHFACHGLSDRQNPLESHILLLSDGDSEPKQVERLSVRDVSNMKIRRAYLAYLGACNTADNSARHLADEGMHVVSGFQLAGFRNVIGNMWPADDKFCLKVSDGFYKYLFDNERGQPDGTGIIEVSDALHHAVKSVREKLRGDYVGWIPFVHFGA